MAHDDVPDHDMNENLFPFHGREPVLPSDDAEKLLRGEPPAAGTTPEVLGVADTLGALRLPPSRGELAGEQAAVAAFAAAAKEKALAPTGSAEPRRRSMLSALTGAKLAVAAVAGSLALGGVSAAAVTGSLPGPLQSVAHTLGAPAAQPDGGVAADDPTESETPKASPSSTGSNGPTSFAVCWFVVHKTNGTAGGPWADHASTDPTADPTDSTDSTADPTDSPTDVPTASPSADSTDDAAAVDALDHGQGEWSQAFARIQTAAAASGQTVLQYCTALLANGSPRAHPSNTHSGDDHGKGSHDGENSSGKSAGKDHGSTQGGGDSGSGSGDGQTSGGDTSGGDTSGGGSDGSGGSGSGD